jgi:hypothetical protein
VLFLPQDLATLLIEKRRQTGSQNRKNSCYPARELTVPWQSMRYQGNGLNLRWFCLFSRTLSHPLPQEFEVPSGPSTVQAGQRTACSLGSGRSKGPGALLPLVYNELRRQARYHLRRQRPNHTLQSAALVHEVYLRLAEEESLQVENRAHFVGIAAQLMRLPDADWRLRAVRCYVRDRLWLV